MLDYTWVSSCNAPQVATPFKTKARSCTDIACLFLFLLCLVGHVFVCFFDLLSDRPNQ